MELLKKVRLHTNDETKMSNLLNTLSKRLMYNIISNIMDVKSIVYKEKNNGKIDIHDMEKTSEFMNKIKFFCHMKMNIVQKDEEQGGGGGYYNPVPLPMIFFGNEEPQYYKADGQEGVARAEMPVNHPSPYHMNGGAMGVKSVQSMFNSLFNKGEEIPILMTKESVETMFKNSDLDVEITDSKVFESISRSINENIYSLLKFYKENYGSKKPVEVKVLSQIVDTDPLFEHMSRIYHPSKK
jgi:TusA-related sulfurtransferase